MKLTQNHTYLVSANFGKIAMYARNKIMTRPVPLSRLETYAFARYICHFICLLVVPF